MDSDAGFAALSFTVGHCAACDRRVLTYPDSEIDEDAVRCVHCDAAVVADLAGAAGEELPEYGYGLLELQGCGSPDCGGGKCGRAAAAASEEA